ncbi:hypothetical protein ACOKFD_06940 [Flagellimonas sp. S174]|uniref:hypothetical protein n=1 Tax=Flagellimonas sp. S174 TaxID=3410790 RepID=UPI003BF5CA28
MRQWIEARLAFDRAKTISPYSKDMIFPIGTYAINPESGEFMDRSKHYIIDEFNAYYEGELSEKKS